MQVTKSTDILILLLASLGFSQFVDKCPEGTFELTDPTQGKVCGKITEIYVAFPQAKKLLLYSYFAMQTHMVLKIAESITLDQAFRNLYRHHLHQSIAKYWMESKARVKRRTFHAPNLVLMS
jgi:hypothetical protein